MERPWLNRYPEGVRYHLEYPAVPAYHFLFDQVARRPDRTALIFAGTRISYAELGAAIDRMASALLRRVGVKPGDRVGLILPNCPQNVIANFAIQRAGAIPVQFNPMYVTREIEHQIKDCGCKVMFTLDLFWEKVRAAGKIDRYIVTGIQDYLAFPLNLLYRLKAKPPKVPAGEAIPFADLLRESAEGFTPAPVDLDQPSVLLYTGGTTGVSKGVMLTHRNYVANILQIKEWLQRGDDRHDTVMGILPMFHSFGYTATLGFALATGCTLVLVPRFDAVDVIKQIHKYKPSSLPGVPTMYVALLQRPELTKYKIKVEFCVSGAAPMPLELMKRFEQSTGAAIMEGYGLTESSPVTHSNPMNGLRKPGSVGLPYPDTEVRIVDLQTGEDLPVGQEGEVVIRGPQVMKGYWNREQETREVLRDGWLYTGDIGRMDEDGYLYIIDRKKDMIIAGGFNIYPREIDEVLYQHPAVREAAAVGVPDPYRGETVKAFVVLREEAQATEDEILAFCKERLAAYKRPRSVEFVDSLPMSAAGKVLRRVLVERERERVAAAADSSTPA